MRLNIVKLSLFVSFIAVGSLAAPLDKRCQSVSVAKVTSPMKSRSELRTRFLKSHNEVRARYGLPSLVWDQRLADYAQNWAQTLKSTRKCQMQHRPQGKYGENLAMNWTSRSLSPSQFDKSPESAVQGWAKECKDYSVSSNKCQGGRICGHFTQLVWKNSKKVGCGMVVCDGKANPYGSGRFELWVCNYDPPGNYVGRSPF